MLTLLMGGCVVQGAELARPSNDPATRTDVLVLFRVRMDRDGYGEEYMVVPLLSRRDATDDVEVVVLDDEAARSPCLQTSGAPCRSACVGWTRAGSCNRCTLSRLRLI